MLTAPSGDWRVLQRIFAAPWEALQHAHPRDQTVYYDGVGATRLACGNPHQVGYGADRCRHGGHGTRLVSMSCQSSLCLRCATVSMDDWVSQVSQVLHEGVSSRHLSLTVPALCRTTFYQNAAVVLSACMRGGVQCRDDCYSTVKGKPLTGGSLVVLHPHGRTGPYHPHLPLLAPSGGDEGPGEWGEPLTYVPDELRRRQWPWPLLTRRRQTLKTEASHPWVEACFRQYPNGVVRHVHKGHGPSQAQRGACDVARSVGSPPISVRRIARYDGAWGTYPSRSHRTDGVEQETVEVLTCSGRLGQHTRPNGFKRMRYDGVQATQTLAQVEVLMPAAVATAAGVSQGAVTIMARLPSRPR